MSITPLEDPVAPVDDLASSHAALVVLLGSLAAAITSLALRAIRSKGPRERSKFHVF